VNVKVKAAEEMRCGDEHAGVHAAGVLGIVAR